MRSVASIATIATNKGVAMIFLVFGFSDLADLAAGAADSLARRFEAAGITLDRRLAASPVLADPHWLHQVITNLLTNALKFTPAGGHVTIRTGPPARRQYFRSATPAPVSPPPTCHVSSIGSGAASRRRRSPAAASAWRSPPSWPRPTEAGSPQAASQGTVPR